MTEKLPWTEIEKQLTTLRAELPDLVCQFPDAADFIPRFADRADAIRDAVEVTRIEDASVRLIDMLIDHGFVDQAERQH